MEMLSIYLVLCSSLEVWSCDLQSHPLTTGLVVGTGTGSETQDGSECFPFLTMDAAIQCGEETGGSVISIMSGRQEGSFEVHSQNITTGITIFSNAGFLALSGSIHIYASGSLTIVDAVLSQVQVSEVPFVLDGSMTLLNCTFQAFQSIGKVYGTLVVSGTRFRETADTILLVKDWSASVTLINSQFQNNFASVLLFEPDFPAISMSPAFLFISNCTFEKNEGEFPLFQTNFRISTESLPSNNSFIVSNSFFISNSAPLFSLFSDYLNVTLDTCEFTENTGTGVTLSQYYSYVTLSQCIWTHNYGVQVLVLDFIGSVLMTGNLFIGQRGSGPIHVLNKGTIDTCMFAVIDSGFLDYNMTTFDRTAGVVLSVNCAIAMTNIYVSNVSVAGQFGELNGFFDFQSSFVQLNTMDINNCSSTQSLFYILFSEVLISDLTLERIALGMNTLFILSMNPNLTFQNLWIDDIRGTNTSESASIALEDLIYIVSDMNSIYVSNATFIAENKFQTIVGQFMTSLLMERVILVNPMCVGQFFGSLTSSVALRDFQVILGSAVTVFENGHNCNFTAVNVVITGSKVHSVLSCPPHSTCSVLNLTLTDVTAQKLVYGLNASISLDGVEVKTSSIQLLVKTFSGANTVLTNLAIEGIYMAICELYQSTLVVSNSVLKTLRSDSAMVNEIDAVVLLDGVTLEYVYVNSGMFGQLTETSDLTIRNCTINAIEVTGMVGFNVDQSSLFIDSSQISEFAVTLVVASESNVTISNSSFINGGPMGSSILNKGSILTCRECDLVRISTIRAENLHSYKGGGIYTEASYRPEGSGMNIRNSVFINCSAHVGGAVLIDATPFEISESSFLRCAADTFGGAIDLVSLSSPSIIRTCNFSSNSANDGGAIKFQAGVPSLISVHFSSNSAVYGPDLASYWTSVQLVPNFDSTEELVSGNSLPKNLTFALIDHFGQVVTDDNLAELAIEESEKVTYGGLQDKVSIDGLFDLSVSPFYVQPGTNATITAKVTENKERKVSVGLLTFTLNFRNCTVGEVYLPDRCVVCAAGTYSFSPDDGECRLCPVHAFCNGRNGFNVSTGFWRSSENTSIVYKCPFSNSCLGGADSACANGYTGKMCTECVPSWYRVGTLYCQECIDYSTGLQLTVFLLQYLICFSFAYYLTEMNPHPAKAAVFRTMIDHTQYSILILRLNTQLPLKLMNVFSAMAYLGSFSLTSLPLQCLVSPEVRIYEKAMAAVMLPGVVFTIYCALMLVRVVKGSRMKTIRFALLTFYLLSPAVLETMASLITSVELDDGKRWLYENTSVEAWTTTHQQVIFQLFVPLFGLYIAIPFMIILAVIIYHPSNLQKLAPFLTSDCAAGRQITELAFSYIKLTCIVFVILTTSRDTLLQITLTLTHLVLIVVISTSLNQYVHKAVLFLHIGSKLVVFLAFMSAAYFNLLDIEESAAGYLFAGAVIAGNAVFYGTCLWLLGRRWGNARNMYFEPIRFPEGSHMRRMSGSIIAPANSLLEVENHRMFLTE